MATIYDALAAWGHTAFRVGHSARLKIAAVALAMVMSMTCLAGEAQAATPCDSIPGSVISGSTSGISISFTAVNQTVHFCPTAAQIQWGLFSTTPVETRWNYPIVSVGNTKTNHPDTTTNFKDYIYSSSKGSYKVHPAAFGGFNNFLITQYDITLMSVGTGGSDSFTLNSASGNTYDGTVAPGSPNPIDSYYGCVTQVLVGSGPGAEQSCITDTPFTVSITALPAVTPIVTAVSPTSGPTAGGTSVTLTGTNFTGATAVTFGGTAATAFTVNSATQITATTPAKAAGAVSVVVTTGAGSSSPLANGFTYVAPTLSLAPASLTDAMVGTAYSGTLSASGGTGPYTYAVTAGVLPAGVTLSSGGTFAGTPTGGGTYNFTVTATDSSGAASGGPYTVSAAYTLTVGAPTVTLSPTSLPSGTRGTSYSTTLTASGGTTPYTYAISAGAVPAGLTLASNGTLSGTPAASGSFNFSVTATDSSTGTGPYTATQSYTLSIAAPTLSLAPASLPGATVGTGFSQAITTSGGGTSPYSYSVTAGALPAGLTLSSGGTLSGTPSAGGSYNFTVTVTDSSSAGSGGPYTASRAYALTVAAPAISVGPTTLPSGTSGSAYNQALSASGGTSPYVYVITAGALPSGLTLSSSGTLSGTSVASGSFTFSVTATDSSTGTGAPYSATRSYTLLMAAPTLTLAPASLPGAAAGAVYSATLSASGGLLPYTYAISAGALPTGLALATDGTLAGTPTAGGSYNFTVTATDATTVSNGGPYGVSQGYSLTVSGATIAIAPSTLPSGTSGTAYDEALSASGGTAPYAYAITAGALPAGLSLSTDGKLTGTPTASGSFTFSATATDSSSGSGPYAATQSYMLVIAAPALSLTPASLTGATLGVAFGQTFTASGGTAPYTYAVTSGALPPGLTLSDSGALSGTPTANGSYSFTVTATDATASASGGPYNVSQSYTLAVALPPPPTAGDSPETTVPGSTSSGTPTTVDLTNLVSGNFTDIQISTQPKHGTVIITQSGGHFVATYTPLPNYSGPDSFGFVAIGPGGTSPEAFVKINVIGAVPVAPALQATTVSGQPVVIDLTATATEGPFTGARIVAVSPSDSVAADLIEGGTPASRLYQLRVTPGGRFSGTATVQYTLSNLFGPSAVATVTVAVTARPDPTQDSLVTGIVAAQAASTERFAQAQIGNFMRRTEQLHGGGGSGNGSRFGITVGGGDGGFQDSRPDRSLAMLDAGRAAGLYASDGTSMLQTNAVDGQVQPGQVPMRGSRSGASASQPADGASGTNGGSTARQVGSVAIWTGGAITVGRRDATTSRDRLSISSSGLSSGIDVKLSDNLIIGAGGGYGGDRTRVGTGGKARVDGDNWVGALYGSYSPGNGAFLDGVLGAGHLRFDTRRLVAANDAIALGRRNGSMLFGSLAGGFDRTTDRFALSAYGRLSLLSADLDPYSESGAGLYDLAFAKRTLNSVSTTLGLRGGVALGQWTPRARLEWLHEFNDTGVQALDYADLPDYAYSVRSDGWLRNILSLEIGTGYQGPDGWQFGIDVGGQAAPNTRAASGKVIVSKRF